MFGLSTSPRLCFEKLLQDVTEAVVEAEGDKLRFEQNLIDLLVSRRDTRPSGDRRRPPSVGG